MGTVAASDHHVEGVPPLAGIGGGVLADGQTPKGALDVHGAGRVVLSMLVKVTESFLSNEHTAAIARVNAWVTLEVDVESSARVCLITFLLAANGIIA
jgi:hypothetical protein